MMRTLEDVARNIRMANTPGCLGEYDDNGEFECGYEDAPMCEDCMYGPEGGRNINPETGEEEITKEQTARAWKIGNDTDIAWNKLNAIIEVVNSSIKNIFENAPDGDFQWDGEAGDEHVYFCDDKDCPHRWHTKSYYEVIGRRNDKLFIELWECDSNGNHDVWADWVEGDDPKWIIQEMASTVPSYFKDWINYWLDCAYRNEDTLQMATGTTIDEYLDFAEENLKYLEMSDG